MLKIKEIMKSWIMKIKHIWSILTLKNIWWVVTGVFCLIILFFLYITVLPYRIIKYIIKLVLYYICLGIYKFWKFLKKVLKKSIKLKTYKDVFFSIWNLLKKWVNFLVRFLKIIFGPKSWYNGLVFVKNKIFNISSFFKKLRLSIIKSFGWKWLMFDKEIFDYREEYYQWAYLFWGTRLYFKLKLKLWKFINYMMSFDFFIFISTPAVKIINKIYSICRPINRLLRRFFFWYDGRKFAKVQLALLFIYYFYCWVGLAYGWNDDRYFFLKCYDLMFVNYFIYKIGVYFYKLPKLKWYQWLWLLIQNIICLILFYKVIFAALKWHALILDTPVEWETMPWVLKVELWLDQRGWFKHHPDSHFRRQEMKNHFKAYNISRFNDIYDKDYSQYMKSKYLELQNHEELPGFIKKLKNAYSLAMDEQRKQREESTSMPVSQAIIIERKTRAKYEAEYFRLKNLYKDQLLSDEIDNIEFIRKNKILNRSIDERMRELKTFVSDYTTEDERLYASGYGMYNGVDKIKMSKPFNLLNPDLFNDENKNIDDLSTISGVEDFIAKNFNYSEKTDKQGKILNMYAKNNNAKKPKKNIKNARKNKLNDDKYDDIKFNDDKYDDIKFHMFRDSDDFSEKDVNSDFYKKFDKKQQENEKMFKQKNKQLARKIKQEEMFKKEKEKNKSKEAAILKKIQQTRQDLSINDEIAKNAEAFLSQFYENNTEDLKEKIDEMKKYREKSNIEYNIQQEKLKKDQEIKKKTKQEERRRAVFQEINKIKKDYEVEKSKIEKEKQEYYKTKYEKSDKERFDDWKQGYKWK